MPPPDAPPTRRHAYVPSEATDWLSDGASQRARAGERERGSESGSAATLCAINWLIGVVIIRCSSSSSSTTQQRRRLLIEEDSCISSSSAPEVHGCRHAELVGDRQRTKAFEESRQEWSVSVEYQLRWLGTHIHMTPTFAFLRKSRKQWRGSKIQPERRERAAKLSRFRKQLRTLFDAQSYVQEDIERIGEMETGR
eukprot:GHVU01197435.1.p1 GENE.GHVU01197435.1~~GHVU01197435.1.p1  ORF type:complete len:196 (+),score=11.19 GHVU01197435.1:138-725(+)